MFSIVVTCAAVAIACLAQSHNLNIPIGSFATKAECDRALIDFAKSFDPGRGGFRFNCERQWTDNPQDKHPRHSPRSQVANAKILPPS